MTNKEILNLARTNNIQPYQLVIAAEVESVFGLDHVDYEKICNKCYEIYLDDMDNNINPYQVVDAVEHLINYLQLDLTEIDLDKVLEVDY